MRARKMFEMLGYHKMEKPLPNCSVGYYLRLDYKHYIEVLFHKPRREVIYSSTSPVYDCVAISMPEMKAIQKQCEELGWLDD